MATKTQRVWYVDKLGSIGIVEKGANVTTKDGYTSDWKSITEVKDMRIYAVSRDVDLAKNNLTGTWTQIPSQFHEAIVNKVIARGYKDPRHMEIDTAQYFDMEYNLGMRKAKRFSKSNYQTTGRIKPQDF